jgi:hypothetical protein
MRWDRKTRRYIDKGRVLTDRQVRREVTDYVAGIKEKLQRQAARFVADEINLAAFFRNMESQVTQAHSVTGAIAYGGRAQLDSERQQRIAAKITSEMEYLANFRLDVEAALKEEVEREESLAFVENRAGMYADAAYSTYENNVMAREFDEGVRMGRRVCEEDDASCEACVAAASTYFTDLDEIDEIGSLDCLNNCRCFIEYADPIRGLGVGDFSQEFQTALAAEAVQ